MELPPFIKKPQMNLEQLKMLNLRLASVREYLESVDLEKDTLQNVIDNIANTVKDPSTEYPNWVALSALGNGVGMAVHAIQGLVMTLQGLQMTEKGITLVYSVQKKLDQATETVINVCIQALKSAEKKITERIAEKERGE